jgi:hypothetical protein
MWRYELWDADKFESAKSEIKVLLITKGIPLWFYKSAKKSAIPVHSVGGRFVPFSCK